MNNMKHLSEDNILEILDGTQNQIFENHIQKCNKCFVKFYAAKARFDASFKTNEDETENLEALINAAKKYNYDPPGKIKKSNLQDNPKIYITKPSVLSIQFPYSQMSNFVSAIGVIVFVFYFSMFSGTHPNTYNFRDNNVSYNIKPESIQSITRGVNDINGVNKKPLINKYIHKKIIPDFKNKHRSEIIKYAQENNILLMIFNAEKFEQNYGTGSTFDTKTDTLIIYLPKNH